MKMNSNGRKTYIAVIGASELNATAPMLTTAEEVGRRIAEAGCVLVNGGLGGTMKHGAKGAKEAGGTTIGILPGPDRMAANEYIDYSIPTDLGFTRNSLVAHSGDAVIALPGSWGTLSELGFAMTWGIPVVAMEDWDQLMRDGDVPLQLKGLSIAKNAEEAVNRAVELARTRSAERSGRENGDKQ